MTTLGRFFLAALFLMSGMSKLGAAAANTAYIAAAGLPFPTLVYVLTLVVEIGAGVLLLIGYQARPAAALALFTVAAGIVFHSNFADQNQAIHFLKNVAIAGGLLQVAAMGAGRFSLDARERKRKEGIDLVVSEK